MPDQQAFHQYLRTLAQSAARTVIEDVMREELDAFQRTDQNDVFTTETSCLTIVWATIQDIRLRKISL